jgi:lipoate synthase
MQATTARRPYRDARIVAYYRKSIEFRYRVKELEAWVELARRNGFHMVLPSLLMCSSLHADDDFAKRVAV